MPRDARPRGDERQREERAADLLGQALRDAGWQLKAAPPAAGGAFADFIARRGRVVYVVGVKAASEGRADRLVPLWSHAYLQARRAGGEKRRPLVVVAAPRVPERVANQILDFAAEYAPDAGAGVLDFEGLRRFRGPGLDDLDSGPVASPRAGASAPRPVDLFSDLNQWMLKVLLAPDVPSELLSAPRARYGSAAQLAAAAGASAMSAGRLVQQLRKDGYLDESSRTLDLVRREELFERWRAAAARRVPEVAMRFLIPGKRSDDMRRLLAERRGCLALFSAADALKLGFVHGVVPYVYLLDKLGAGTGQRAFRNAGPILPGQQPDFIVREAPAPQSVFRGMVRVGELPVCDVIQIWLDVSVHPARGKEQADFIWKRVLSRVCRERSHG